MIISEILPERLTTQPIIWIEQLAPFHADSLSLEQCIPIHYSIEDRSFAAYSTVEHIWNQLITYAEQAGVNFKLVHDTRHSFEQLMNSWKRLDMNSDSIIYSIIRRISRESNTTAKWIDQSAAKMVRLIEALAMHTNKRVVCIIEQAEWLDRPSIRLLNRLYKLMPFGETGLILRFACAIPAITELDEPFDISCSIAVARARIFKRLLSEQSPLICAGEVPVATYHNCSYQASEYGILADAALALVTQNYENAYLACFAAFNKPVVSEEAYRICGLVHANLSLYDQAYTLFQTAAVHARSLPVQAHIECLCALLAVKRFYNLDIANEHYQKALTLVNESDEQNRLERGWVYNGLSFMDTVAASRLTGSDKQQQLEAVFYRERTAFQLIKQDNNPGALYLRYNLLSNMTFLLEIKGDYQNALKMWESAFNRLLKNQHAFEYRTGMLAWKAGELEKAISLLLKARDEATRQEDRLDLEGINEALGYIFFHKGQYEQAFDYYELGMELSWSLAHWSECKRQLIGCLKAMQEMQQQTPERIWNKMIQFAKEPRIAQAERQFFAQSRVDIWSQVATYKLKMPKSKLSSYHPSVDLEMTPDVDMNDFLINQDEHLAHMKQKITPVSR
ncbi:tetratricopeptide repeat protein [Paenibacillus campi]|uniref:tetratricopeptide repeat protein n=1 Tax=Paenibacillus campi TaxID=3106031 RepID=UPI002AFF4077|nr:tetratricopeptide repeat protein [Paenibacillus sp. SGZ-1009]